MNNFNPENYYKTNLIIWMAIMIGMIILVGVTYFLNQSNTFIPIVEIIEVKNVLFILILIAALTILLLKRSFLNFEKVYTKVESITTSDKKIAYFNRLRRNYIIIWALSESIILLGFVEFILLVKHSSFEWFAIIGLYAIAINYPKKSLFQNHLELLAEREGSSE